VGLGHAGRVTGTAGSGHSTSMRSNTIGAGKRMMPLPSSMVVRLRELELDPIAGLVRFLTQ